MKTNNIYEIKDKTMKHLLTLGLILGFFFFFGCDQVSDVTSPTSDSPNQEQKLISLPTPSGGITVETIMTRTKAINGDDGGTFYAAFNFRGGPFGRVRCSSQLLFLPGAFSGVKYIKKTFNSKSTVMTLGPSLQFNVPVKYTLRYLGVDLSNVNPETLDFVYIAPDGTYHPCEYESIDIDVERGLLIVRYAELNHFSRYGFVN
ncbi:MAG: hypothetical protein ACW99A_21700 [Candidatus Kariarchaeaceae archaeon]|jgi:hypothetical protein